MNLYDIVAPLTVEEAKATKTRLDAKCWKGKHKEGTKVKGGVRVNNCVPNESIAEDAWHSEGNTVAGQAPGQWTSEHDQWTKESVDMDEAVGYESNKAYAEVGTHKRYTVYVGKKKFNDAVGFIAVAVNPRTKDAKFKASGPTQQEAVAKLQAEVDKEIDVATKVSGAATIDFNVDFVRDVLEMSSNTFYAKLVPGPKLVIAGKEMEQYPDIMKSEGFKASSIRTVGDSEGATKLPAMPLSASGAVTAQLIANGRYALGAETIDKDGNRVFDLEFDSVVADPRERIRMGAPAITIGTKRETKESSNDFMAVDSTSPVGGHVDEARLHVGDPVVVTAPNEFEGKTGEISEFSPSGKFVIVNLYNYGEHSMHLSDVEYNQYADDEDELDEAANPQREKAGKIINRCFGKISEYEDAGWEYLDRNAPVWFDLFNDDQYDGDIDTIIARAPIDLLVQSAQELMDVVSDLPYELDEGWSDAIVAQRTGRPRTPYSVYIKGKKWKDFENDDHAEAVANKLRAKFKADGRDPGVITIAPTDYDVKEAISKKDLLGKLAKDLNTPFKKAKAGKLKSNGVDFTKGEHWTGPDKDDPSYTRNFGHGYPDTPDNRSHDRYVNKSLKKDVDEGAGPHSKLDQKIVHLLTNGIPADAIARKLDIPVEWVHEVAEYNMPDSAIDYNDPRNTAPTNRFGEGVTEAETDYSKRRQRERDVDAGKPVTKQRQPRMTDYQKKRAQDKKDMALGESYWTKLQNERNTKIANLVNELTESINK